MEIVANKETVKLVTLCKKGDAKAQYRLYKQYCKAMYNIAMRMTNCQNTSEDILQDAFTKAFTEMNKLKDEKAFGGWLKRIVINRSIDACRNNRLYITDMESIGEQHQEISEEVNEAVDAETLHFLIRKLPEGARQILVLRALEGYRHAEIAEHLNISESTAKTQYFRAKQLLAEMIKATNNEARSGENIERKQTEA